MPEQLTKHPEVTLQVLKSAGAECGTGAAQTILKACPAERFCKLPGGEVCIYGLPEASRMTQIRAADWQALLGAPLPAAPPPAAVATMPAPDPAPTAAAASPLVVGGSGLLAGLALGVVLTVLLRRR